MTSNKDAFSAVEAFANILLEHLGRKFKHHSLVSVLESSTTSGLSLTNSNNSTTNTSALCPYKQSSHAPKTLCNACGVQYKSRRLVPEYRSASRPTFSAELHSNCHRKIMEMRRHMGMGKIIGNAKRLFDFNLSALYTSMEFVQAGNRGVSEMKKGKGIVEYSFII
ncbi:hypothetical protein I3760_02G126700 [Carya illinoinensis]|nr:hypothetical protein I3760_02G126700 [Carya illinoinensis]